MGCKPSKESDEVTKGTMQKLNKEQSQLSKKETTEALVSNGIPDESKHNQIFNKPEQDLIDNNAEEDLIPDKPEEDLDKAIEKEELEENKEKENELGKAVEKKEIEENEEVENVLYRAIGKEEIEEKEEEVNVLDEEMEEVVNGSVVDSPNSFASIRDEKVVEVTKFIEDLEVVEEEGVEVEGEMENVEVDEGNSSNNKESADLK